MTQVYFIRHGEAEHNHDYDQFGEEAYYLEKNRFSKLTPKGVCQAHNVIPPEVDIVITSSLPRTLQTTSIIFDNNLSTVPIYTTDIVRECNYHHPCNERKRKSKIVSEYPKYDSTTLSEEDLWFRHGDPEDRKVMLDRLLDRLPHSKIAIVSHKTFIMDFLESHDKELDNIQNCEIVKYGSHCDDHSIHESI